MKARYVGVCQDCDGVIRINDEVRREKYGWVHVECDSPHKVKEVACLVCFLIHPVGACDRQ